VTPRVCGLVTGGALRARCIVMVDMIDLADVEGMLLAAYGAVDTCGSGSGAPVHYEQTVKGDGGGEVLATGQPAAEKDVEVMLLAAYDAADARHCDDADGGGGQLAAGQPAAPAAGFDPLHYEHTVSGVSGGNGGEGLAAGQPAAVRGGGGGGFPVLCEQTGRGGGCGGVPIHYEQTVGLAVVQPASPAAASEVASGVGPVHCEQIVRGGGDQLAGGIIIDHGHFN